MSSEPYVPRVVSPIRLTSAHLRRVIGERPGAVAGALFNVVVKPFTRIKHETRERWARWIGGLVYRLGIRRSVARENLALAMPEKSAEEREAIVRGVYVTMARIVLESLADEHRLPPGWAEQPVVGAEAWKALEAHLATGKGALLVTAHFGNWETLGEMLILRGAPLNALVRPLKGALNTRIAENRLRAGAGLIYPQGAVQETTDALNRGESVYMLLDQGLAKKGVFVPFFGRPASTTPAMALAAQRTGVPAFVVMGVRDGIQMRMHVEGPFVMPEAKEGVDPIVEHTAQVTAALERVIRKYPEQWLWLHKRWKYQPPELEKSNQESQTPIRSA